MRALGMIVFCIALTALGAAGGFLAGTRTDAGGEGEEAAHAAESPMLSPQALKNLGVEIGPAKLGTWTKYAEVQAVVVDRPENEQPVAAPLAGRVTAIHVATGGRVGAGGTLVTLARDPIARPRTDLTSDLLLPISEQVHEAANKLRAANKRLEIAERELARLGGLRSDSNGGLPVVSRSKIIEMEYEKERAALEVSNARNELERHGLSRVEISAVGQGEHPPANPTLWRQALEHNDLWNAHSTRILHVVPETDRNVPWAVAAVGELTAAGLANESVATMLEGTPSAARRFAESAGLLLQGTPVETVRLLASSGALEPAMVVRAPPGPPDWDVEVLEVRQGQRLDAGATLAVLHDARHMWLRVEPVGGEVASVAAALEAGAKGAAVPLVPGTGPKFEDVRLVRMHSDGASAAVAIAVLENEALAGGDAKTPRTWKLRAGTRYQLRLPISELGERFLLPAEALTDDGAETVVYVPDGRGFKAVPVQVEARDARRVAIANDGSLFPDDPVVLRGAYALGLALQKKSGAGGGHGHAHN